MIYKWPGEACTLVLSFTHRGPAESLYLAWGLAVAGITDAFPNKILWLKGTAANPDLVLSLPNELTDQSRTIQVTGVMPSISSFIGVQGAVPNSIDCYMVLIGSVSGSLVGDYDRVSDVYGMMEPNFGAIAYQFT